MNEEEKDSKEDELAFYDFMREMLTNVPALYLAGLKKIIDEELERR